MKKKIKNNISYIILIILFVLLLVFFIKEYIDNEKQQYTNFNDMTRGDIVMSLSYNKDNVVYYDYLRYVQMFTNDKKISKGDLIYDFATYEFVPILNYLNKKNENEELISSFSGIMEFLVDFNSATIGFAEDIFVVQPDGKYYTYKDGIYTYNTSKEVVSKNAFIKMYNEYLETINCKNVEKNFINQLLKIDKINSKYTYSQLTEIISNDYNEFYKDNENEIIKVISNDLSMFAKFLYTDYIFIDRDNNDKRYLLKDVETDLLEISFNFTEGDRIYEWNSKYFTHNYILDINNVWDQLKEKGYPMLYS